MYKLERVSSEDESTSGTQEFAPYYSYTVKDEKGVKLGGVTRLEIVMDTKDHAVPEVYMHRVSMTADGKPVETVEVLKCCDLSFTAAFVAAANVTGDANLRYNVE